MKYIGLEDRQVPHLFYLGYFLSSFNAVRPGSANSASAKRPLSLSEYVCHEFACYRVAVPHWVSSTGEFTSATASHFCWLSSKSNSVGELYILSLDHRPLVSPCWYGSQSGNQNEFPLQQRNPIVSQRSGVGLQLLAIRNDGSLNFQC